MTPADIRQIAQRLGMGDEQRRDAWHALRYAASEIERLQTERDYLKRSDELHDAVLDGIAAREREKVQKEMACLRARIAVLSGDTAEFEWIDRAATAEK